ncbi:MAG TPA: hypothetical protein PKK00_02450 [Bacteroidales bacterium]|mgnify:CR=1 FL=1|nr:hypothetical protein [Bacteroidales bacterium]HPS15596.1 hypothetical protein [Bacteroidales bacterium]
MKKIEDFTKGSINLKELMNAKELKDTKGGTCFINTVNCVSGYAVCNGQNSICYTGMANCSGGSGGCTTNASTGCTGDMSGPGGGGCIGGVRECWSNLAPAL